MTINTALGGDLTKWEWNGDWKGVLAGGWDTQPYNTNVNGRWLSSTAYSGTSVYVMKLPDVNPLERRAENYGASIRCVLE
jgi:hypothetical protein